MTRISYEELEKAFREVCNAINEGPISIEEFAGEYSGQVFERLYEQDLRDSEREKPL